MCRPYKGHGRPRSGSGRGSEKRGRRRRHDVSRRAERQRGRQAGKQVGVETGRWRGSSQSGREGEPYIRTAARMHGDTRICRHACTEQASNEPATDRTRARGTGGRGCGKGRSISSRGSPPRPGRRERGGPAAAGAPRSAQRRHVAIEDQRVVPRDRRAPAVYPRFTGMQPVVNTAVHLLPTCRLSSPQPSLSSVTANGGLPPHAPPTERERQRGGEGRNA